MRPVRPAVEALPVCQMIALSLDGETVFIARQEAVVFMGEFMGALKELADGDGNHSGHVDLVAIQGGAA